MVVTCSIKGCRNRFVKGGVTFHRFPVDPGLRQRWISATSRCGWEPKKHDRICGDHFLKGWPSRDPNDPDYVPQAAVVMTSRTRAKKSRRKTVEIQARDCRLQKAEREKNEQPQDDTEFRIEINEDTVPCSEDNFSKDDGLCDEDQFHPLDCESSSESDDSAISSDDIAKKNVKSQKSTPSKIGHFEMDNQIIGGTSMSELKQLSRRQLWLLSAVLSKEIVRLQAIIHSSSRPVDMPEQEEFKVVYEGSPFRLKAVHTKTGAAVLKSHIIAGDKTTICSETNRKNNSIALRSASSPGKSNGRYARASMRANSSGPSVSAGVIHAFACGHVCRICNSKLKLASLHDRFGSVLPKVALIPALTEEPKQDDPSDCPLEMTAETIDKDNMSTDLCVGVGRESYIMISTPRKRWKKSPKERHQFKDKANDVKIRRKNNEVVDSSSSQLRAHVKTTNSHLRNIHRYQKKQKLSVFNTSKIDSDLVLGKSSEETSDSICLNEARDSLDQPFSVTKSNSLEAPSIPVTKPEGKNLTTVVDSNCNTRSNNHLCVKQFLSALLTSNSSDEIHSSGSKTHSSPVFTSVPNNISVHKCLCHAIFSCGSPHTQCLPLTAKSPCFGLQSGQANRTIPVCSASSSNKASSFPPIVSITLGTDGQICTTTSTDSPSNSQGPPSQLTFEAHETAKDQTKLQAILSGPKKYNDGYPELKRILMTKKSLASEIEYLSSLSPLSDGSVRKNSRKTANIVTGTLGEQGKAEYFLERGYIY